jgi:phage gp46-like protein
MRDLLLQITDDYKVDFVYDETTKTFTLTSTMADVVKNNIILSIMIRIGELPGAPSFGSRRHEITSGGDAGARDLERFDAEAMQWIVDIGRAKSIAVKAWPEPGEPGRLNEIITAVLMDGESLPFETFYRVG